MRLVENKKKYWEFIRSLRNLQGVKEGFIQQDHITAEDHEQFMAKYGENYYICLIEDKQAGFVGVIDDDIRVATCPRFQKLGVAKFMINELFLIIFNVFKCFHYFYISISIRLVPLKPI